jgi:hypothetical protein
MTMDDATGTGRIDRAAIESKFREVQADLTATVEGARQRVVVVGAAAGGLVLVAAYVLGRRAGRRRSTVVEIRRL